MRKILFIIICTLVFILPIFGNGNNEGTSDNSDPEATGTIRFLTMAEYHNGLEKSIKGFEASHPGVTVETEEFPFAQLFDAIEIKLGSRNSNFDVVLTDATMVSGYAYRGFISPLTDYFSEDDKNNFTPALINSGSYQGEFYSPPLKNSCHVLWYNKKLLDNAGIPYPSSNPEDRMTWEEVTELSKKIMSGANDPTVYPDCSR